MRYQLQVQPLSSRNIVRCGGAHASRCEPRSAQRLSLKTMPFVVAVGVKVHAAHLVRVEAILAEDLGARLEAVRSAARLRRGVGLGARRRAHVAVVGGGEGGESGRADCGFLPLRGGGLLWRRRRHGLRHPAGVDDVAQRVR